MADDSDANEDAATYTANPAPETTFSSVFDKFTGLLTTVGGNYLTQRGQLEVAKLNADTQARLNSYSAVNPSLGAVNPAAATAVANQTLIQKWLPGGSPTAGAPATGQQAVTQIDLVKYGIIAGVGLLIILIVVKLFRK